MFMLGTVVCSLKNLGIFMFTKVSRPSCFYYSLKKTQKRHVRRYSSSHIYIDCKTSEQNLQDFHIACIVSFMFFITYFIITTQN